MTKRYSAAEFIALLVFCGVNGSAWARGMEPSRDCPVRFVQEDATQTTAGIPAFGLSGAGLASVRLLAPRALGLAVLRVDESGAEPVYGVYRLDEVRRTQEYALRSGMSGLEWRTVAEDQAATTSDVRPGFFRVLLQYAAAGEKNPSGGGTVCFALSPVFELKEGFRLHQFE